MERAIAYTFADRSLLERALTHSSRAYEDRDGTRGNERLEFLGDAVLDLAISELLMEARPDADEGELSRARASLVNARSLALHARELGLGRAVRLGRGEARSGGREKPRVLANAFEAIVGAMYLDGGMDAARAFVRFRFRDDVAAPRTRHRDPKTQLQECVQARGDPVPDYVITAERGPDHAREFEAEVRLNGDTLGKGVGRSKRDAEREAALRALDRLLDE